jgi:hypothetical protein
VTTTNQVDATGDCQSSGQDRHSDRDERREKLSVPPVTLARVLGHLRRRARSHPNSLATGLHPMSDDQWRACIAGLRRHGNHITKSIATQGDRTANEIGCALASEPPPTCPRPSATMHRPVATRPAPSRSVDRLPSLATLPRVTT